MVDLRLLLTSFHPCLITYTRYLHVILIGHNFDSGHTHDYSPVIDTCGTSCPTSGLQEKSATIMSYCHLCGIGMKNMEYTFGGKFIGSDRSSVGDYERTPTLTGDLSYLPQRVNAVSVIRTSSC